MEIPVLTRMAPPFPVYAPVFPACCMTSCVDFQTWASDFGVQIGVNVGMGGGFSGSSIDQTLILHFELPVAPV